MHFKINGGSAAAGILCAALMVSVLTAGPAAAGGPAVSDVNAKISTFNGGLDAGTGGELLGGVAGSLTAPLGHDFGVQLDGALADVQGNFFYDAGLHAFRRDPDQGMLGLYAGYAHLDAASGKQVRRIGFEGQRFLDRLTIDTALGYESGDVSSNIYGHAKLELYLSPNFMVSGGYIFEEVGELSTGSEYQFASNANEGVSLFAESKMHSSNTYTVLAGLKVTFGQNMSLIDRHRRQDPDTYLGPDLSNAQQAAANGSTAPTGPTQCPIFTGTEIIEGADNCTCTFPYTKGFKSLKNVCYLT